MINVVILDDEAKAIQSLEWEIKSFCPSVNVLATFENPFDARDFILSHDIDCIFLDIDMPQMDGFRFLDFFPKRDFEVIITTAYDQYGIQALKQRAIDYLLKPIDSDDLKKAVDKIENQKSSNNIKDILEEMLINMNNSQIPTQKKINISCDGKIYFLEPHEILYCESDGNYCNVFLDNGQKLFLTQILKNIEEKLPKSIFYRVHNSFVVNLNKVREYQKNEGYLVLTNGKHIPVSRNKKNLFIEK
ncbi:MAG: LytTR family DNA-binding domain-containing protein [Bacteroidetes bacterium]|nr:LytTR family DNA-binding domain-containing protein [Bacteroidota bacterium]